MQHDKMQICDETRKTLKCTRCQKNMKTEMLSRGKRNENKTRKNCKSESGHEPSLTAWPRLRKSALCIILEPPGLQCRCSGCEKWFANREEFSMGGSTRLRDVQLQFSLQGSAILYYDGGPLHSLGHMSTLGKRWTPCTFPAVGGGMAIRFSDAENPRREYRKPAP